MEYKCKCSKEFKTRRSLNSHARFCKLYEKIEKKQFTGYCECGKYFEKPQSLNAHYSRCLIHRNGETPTKSSIGWAGWNKGMTKDTNNSVKQTGKTLSSNIESGLTIPGFKNKSHSVECKRNLSIKRIEFLEENPNSNINWFIVNNGLRDIKVQGTWELNVALWLNSLSIKWDRKSVLFDIYRRYTPDFWIPEKNIYIEVKGFLRDTDIKKMKTVIEQTGIKIKLLRIEQYKNLSELRIDDIPDFE